MTKKTLSIVVTAMIALCVVYVVSSVARAVLSYPERHAKSCLVTITEIADRAVNVEIPKGMYREAIFGAEYIESHYPVGAVLPEDHPFAERYSEERRRQIARITRALKADTGMDFGENWSEWKSKFGSSKFDRAESDETAITSSSEES